MYSMRAVGWAMDATNVTTVVPEAFNRALRHRQIKPDHLFIRAD